jgi:hypothetical protein
MSSSKSARNSSDSHSDQSLSFTRADALLLFGLMLAAIASTLPFLYAAQGRLPEAGDLTVHWPRMLMFDETLRSGVWYPRWLGGMNYGYGAATTMFYAPLVYYALSAIHALLGDWSRSIEAVAALAAMGSAAAFYFYARSFLSPTASAIAALLYLLLPYRLIDLYHRGALAELIAFAWMPLVMLMLGASVKRMSARRIIFGAIAFALLIVTHPPVAYAFSISLVIFVTAWAIRLRSWRPALSGSLIVMLGGALSAFYWLPAIAEVGYVNQSVTDLFDRNKGYITDLFAGSTFEKLIAATIIATSLLFFLFLALARSSKRPDPKDSSPNQHASGWIIVGLVSIFMMLPFAEPLARLMPGISGMAFMWRWLAITNLATSALAGAVVDKLYARNQPDKKHVENRTHLTIFNRGRIRELLAATLTIGVLTFGVISCARASNLKLRFIAPADFVEQDFTPAGAPAINELPRDISMRLLSNSPGSHARLIEWKPQERVMEVFAATGDTLHVCSFMFPGWEASVDGNTVPIRIEARLKTMLIDVPQGSHTIKLVFANTFTGRRAQALSFITLCASAFVIILTEFAPLLKQALRL